MRFIDKRSHHVASHSLNLKFLQDCFNEEESRLIPRPDSMDSFENFNRREYRKGDSGWERLLLEEQGSLCCYCMRRLNPEEEGTINIEHIIPRSVQSGDEFDYYIQQASVLDEYVTASDRFEVHSRDEIDSLVKMPHMIALTNLLAACNGKGDFSEKGCCCNSSRGNDRIFPIMLREDQICNVSFDCHGVFFIADQDDSLEGIVTDLNDDTLKEIRTVWYRISFSNLTEAEIIHYDKWQMIKLMKEVYHVSDFTTISEEASRFVGDITTEEEDHYFRLFKEYSWFLDYYRSIR